jgi:hypothetical protein
MDYIQRGYTKIKMNLEKFEHTWKKCTQGKWIQICQSSI